MKLELEVELTCTKHGLRGVELA